MLKKAQYQPLIWIIVAIIAASIYFFTQNFLILIGFISAGLIAAYIVNYSNVNSRNIIFLFIVLCADLVTAYYPNPVVNWFTAMVLVLFFWYTYQGWSIVFWLVGLLLKVVLGSVFIFLAALPFWTLMFIACYTIHSRLAPGTTPTLNNILAALPNIIFSLLAFFLIMFSLVIVLEVADINIENRVFRAIADIPGKVLQIITELYYDMPTAINKGKVFLSKYNPTILFDRWVTRQIQIATGDYYTGEVDRYADAQLGVVVENMKPIEKRFYIGPLTKGENDIELYPVVVTADLRGRSMAIEDCTDYLDGGSEENSLYSSFDECLEHQQVNVKCGVKDKLIKGNMIPQTPVLLYDLEGGAEGLECSIPVTSFKSPKSRQSSEIVWINAFFPFTTKAYIKTYFMDGEKKREMKRAKVDIFREFKIFEREPETVYTGGPIRVGIGVLQDLPLDAGRTTRIGFTVENRWLGKISEVIEIKVITPDNINLLCPFYFDDKGNNEYTLREDRKRQFKDIEKAKTLQCQIQPTNSVDLLESAPITAKFIKFEIDYKYTLTEEAAITIRKGDGINGRLNDCASYCDDDDGCDCLSTRPCAENDASVKKEYNCNGKSKPIKPPTKPSTKPPTKPQTKPSTQTKPKNAQEFDVDVSGYFIPSENDYSRWCGAKGCFEFSDEIGRAYNSNGKVLQCLFENKGWCCIPNNDKGFYDAVKCNGGGQASDGKNFYSHSSIKSTKSASSFAPLSTSQGNTPDPFITLAVNDQAGTPCHIPYGKWVWLEMDKAPSRNGWYLADDTGSAFRGKCKVDVYTGAGSSAKSLAYSLTGKGKVLIPK
jgi:3D (Asp-Asp-Asp) domain-containing protein